MRYLLATLSRTRLGEEPALGLDPRLPKEGTGLRQRDLHNRHQHSARVRAIARREPGVSQTLWAAAASSNRTPRRDAHGPSAHSLDRDFRIPAAIS